MWNTFLAHNTENNNDDYCLQKVVQIKYQNISSGPPEDVFVLRRKNAIFQLQIQKINKYAENVFFVLLNLCSTLH